MARKCVIKTCSNSQTMKQKGLIACVMFHKFPSNVKRRSEWVNNIQNLANHKELISSEAVICNDHFEEDMYNLQGSGKKWLTNEAKPTIFFNSEIETNCSDFQCLSASQTVESHPKDSILPDFTEVEESYLDIEYLDFSEPRTCSEVSMLSDCIEIESCSEIKCLEASENQHFRVTSDKESTICKRRKLDCDEIVNKQVGSEQMPAKVATQTLEQPLRPHILPTSTVPKLKTTRLRYPGDIKGNESRHHLSAAILLCQQKIKAQAKNIQALKR